MSSADVDEQVASTDVKENYEEEPYACSLCK